MPEVSIITASYNYENYIKKTIESVINQTFQDWEMIIVDDGSSDNSLDVIRSFCQKDERIKLYTHSKNQNKGLPQTLQLGVSKANSAWLVFLESDDLIEKNYLKDKFDIVHNFPNVDVIFNDVNLFGDEETISAYDKYFKKQKKILSKYSYPAKLLKAFKSTHANLIPTFSCVMIKKKSFEKLDFNSPIPKGLDFYLWLQLLKTSEFYYIDKKLTNWRMHKSSYMNSIQINKYHQLLFDIKRIFFLYGRFAFLKYFLIFFKFLRKNLISVRFDKKKKEVVIFGFRII